MNRPQVLFSDGEPWCNDINRLRLVFMGAYIHCEISQAVTLERIWSMPGVLPNCFFFSQIHFQLTSLTSLLEYNIIR